METKWFSMSVAGAVLLPSRRRGASPVAGSTAWTSGKRQISAAIIRANAAIAGVGNRLAIDTGDARNLPYPDASFDVVSSMTAIHNIGEPEGRRKAISEAWRVLRPGGQILIFDIRHARSYLQHLPDLGAINIALAGPIILWGPLGWRFTATKPPESQEFT